MIFRQKIMANCLQEGLPGRPNEQQRIHNLQIPLLIKLLVIGCPA